MKKIKIFVLALAMMFAGAVYADTNIPMLGSDTTDVAVNTSRALTSTELDAYAGQYVKSIQITITDLGDGSIDFESQLMGTKWLECNNIPVSLGVNNISLSDSNCSTYNVINTGSVLIFGAEFFGGPSARGSDIYLYGNVVIGSLGGGGGEGESETSLSSMISEASSGIQSVSGASIGSMVSWTADNLIKVFLGSGLMLLLALRYWIIALIVIGIIVYFAYRAFKFYRT